MDDLVLAQKIVRGSYINFSSKEPFIETSSIYRFTNEDITSYFHHLQDKKKVLSVIGSGNQILNTILGGTREIDCFDISVFPQYYLFLQLASIMALSKEEYLNYFLSEDREVLFSDDLYDLISNHLTGKYKEFWDTLYNFDDGIDIYNSLLFRQDVYYKELAIENNPYLQGNNYDKLKHILKTESIQINPFVANILKNKIDKEYDLINLSNILAYYLGKKEFVRYLENNFSLSSNGEIINYFYTMSAETEEEFKRLLNPNSYIEELGKRKLLVYKKNNLQKNMSDLID